jgi:hypothetical protein
MKQKQEIKFERTLKNQKKFGGFEGMIGGIWSFRTRNAMFSG